MAIRRRHQRKDDCMNKQILEGGVFYAWMAAFQV